MKKQYILILAVLFGLIALFFYFKDEKIYTSQEYSPSGKLIGTNEYVIRNNKTIMHGKFVNYNEKGIKISEGQFVDGHVKGKCIYYYDNGEIETIQFKNGGITEESIYYNSNGLLEKYVMYDNLGESAFIISFDEKGPKQYNGYSLLEVYQYQFTHKNEFNVKKKQVLKVGGVLKYQFLLANIPNAKRSFKIENISVDETKVKRTITKKEPTSIIVEEILTKKGKNTIRSIVQYKFNDKVTPTINDTVSFDINVY